MKKVPATAYLGFINEIKQRIIRSRYQASRLANREQLLLYLYVGNRISENIKMEKWGAKVLQQIAFDLQTELPGLRGFSERSLKNMRQFAGEYSDMLFPLIAVPEDKNFKQGKAKKLKTPIRQSATAQLKTPIRQSATAQLKKPQNQILLSGEQLNSFFNISFTHHILLLAKCKNKEERFFYMQMASGDIWSVSALEHQIKSKLYKHRGALPNNFKTTLPLNMQSSALNAW